MLIKAMSPAHKWLQTYRVILLSTALITSFFVGHEETHILLFVTVTGFLAFMLIITFKTHNVRFFIDHEPYPTMIVDIFLISALVKVTGGLYSVFHLLYIVEFILMCYFYGFNQTVIAGLLASAGFYFASYSHHGLLTALLHIILTFLTALFVGFVARHRFLLQKKNLETTYRLAMRVNELQKARKAMQSLGQIASAMSGARDVEEIVVLMDSYVRHIPSAEKAVFILPGKDKATVFLKDVTSKGTSQRFSVGRNVLSAQKDIAGDETRNIADTQRDLLFKSWSDNARAFPVLHKFIADFKSAIVSSVLHGDEIYGFIIVANCNHGHAFGAEAEEMVTTIKHALAVYFKGLDSIAKLERKYDEVVQMAAKMVDLKDTYTLLHSRRVAGIAAETAKALGLDEKHRQRLKVASLLHDVGKVGIPDAVLNKPQKLSSREFEQIKLHPVVGGELLKSVTGLEKEAVWVTQHHERYDGKGYPAGLKGKEIFLEARIIAVADAFESMTADRAYRSRMPHMQAVKEIQRNSGIQFDPRVVEAFLKIEKKLGAQVLEVIGADSEAY